MTSLLFWFCIGVGAVLLALAFWFVSRYAKDRLAESEALAELVLHARPVAADEKWEEKEFEQ